jgi:L-alanine-DL-glutamate epimerase-like enolase superfamily enzyme
MSDHVAEAAAGVLPGEAAHAAPVHSARVTWLRKPLPRALADATHELHALDVVVLELRDADGRVGTAYALGFDYGTELLARCLRDAAAAAVGRLPADHRAVWQEAWQHNEYLGREGLNAWGMAAVDIALHDLLARQLDVPLWRMLGAARSSIPAYGSGGWVSYSDEELLAETTGYVARGFRAVKVKVGGHRTAGEDVARLQLVREAIGPDVELMIDANQGLDRGRALALATAAQSLGLRWFEEPLPPEDVAGYRALRAATNIPIAMGERNFFARGLRDALASGATDVAMPDALRIGGVQEWLATAATARAFGVAIAPHFYREFDVPLACVCQNAIYAESFDWLDDVFDWDVAFRDGSFHLGSQPGLGLTLAPDARERWTVRTFDAPAG